MTSLLDSEKFNELIVTLFLSSFLNLSVLWLFGRVVAAFQGTPMVRKSKVDCTNNNNNSENCVTLITMPTLRRWRNKQYQNNNVLCTSNYDSTVIYQESSEACHHLNRHLRQRILFFCASSLVLHWPPGACFVCSPLACQILQLPM